jgi:hypothetical protein
LELQLLLWPYEKGLHVPKVHNSILI